MEFLAFLNDLLSQNLDVSVAFLGLIQPLVGLAGAMMSNATARQGQALQYDTANKNRASENMRHAIQMQNEAVGDRLDTQYRNTQTQQNAFRDLIGVMRDSFLR